MALIQELFQGNGTPLHPNFLFVPAYDEEIDPLVGENLLLLENQIERYRELAAAFPRDGIRAPVVNKIEVEAVEALETEYRVQLVGVLPSVDSLPPMRWLVLRFPTYMTPREACMAGRQLDTLSMNGLDDGPYYYRSSPDIMAFLVLVQLD